MTAEHIETSIQKALKAESNLTESELAVGGFSTPTMRHLFNNICNIEGTYLEVGLWMGGTFVASFNKGLTSIGIENYAQDFGVVGVKDILEANIDKHQGNAKEIQLHFTDCFTIDKSLLPDNIDIYFFDGNHSFESQAKALPFFIDKMASTFLFVVDDFSWTDVFEGTNAGFEALKGKIEIVNCWPLRGYRLQEDPIWHNSVGLFLIKKK